MKKPKPPCIRCGLAPGDHVWEAETPAAAKVFTLINLCPKCVDALRNCINNGRRKHAAPPAASAAPAPPPRSCTRGPSPICAKTYGKESL
jgi:hypothetical protein